MVIAAGAMLIAAGVAELSCGGTTGTPAGASALGADLGADATTASLLEASTVVDATTSVDAGTFDVALLYWDGTLPDISAPVTVMGADGGGGYPWPDCPPWIPVNARLKPMASVISGVTQEQLPAVYSDASDTGVAVAPDGSACASYGWFGSPSIDHCIALAPPVGTNTLVPYFPPCNWCEEAGVVSQGTAEGESRYSTCLALYQCMQQTGCGTNPISCLCGDQSDNTSACAMNQSPPGPCAAQELASLELLPNGAGLGAIANYTVIPAGSPGYCASVLNAIYFLGTPMQSACFSEDGGDQ
jgi:hypothetical protein